MRSGKFEIFVWLALIIFAVPIEHARGQQPADTDIDRILTGQQNGTEPGSQTASPIVDQLGQMPRSADGQRKAGGVDLQDAPERDRSNSNGRSDAAVASRELNQLPPDPLTEFQRLVQSSTGEVLPLYGYRLFRNAPSTFAPLDRVPVPLNYVIGPGDELLVQVWGQVTLNSRFTVDRAGDIYVPQLGTVRVAGLPFAQLQSYLKAQMSRVFRNFDLNVNMGQLRSIQIFVVGQARRPGSYTVSSLSTLVNALFETGGPTPQGSLRHIQLKRSDKVVVDFDLYDLLEHGDKSKDAPLLPGDVIFIPPTGPQVAVVGSVNAPAIYELRSETSSTLGEALALAAGPTNAASASHVRLEHVDAHSMRSVTDLTLDQSGLTFVLRDGDIIELTAVIDRFRNGVTLRGNVANPGQYMWKPGMHVGDLFPERDALVTRDYWLRRGRLGEPVLAYTPSSSGASANEQQTQSRTDPLGIPSANARIAGPALGNRSTAIAAEGPAESEFKPRNDVTISAPEIDWSYAVIERQDTNNLTTSLLPFNLGRLVLDGDKSQNLELKPSDVITIFSKADIKVPQAEQTRFVRLEGEFLSSGVYSVLPGETLEHLVERAGGITPDGYLYGSEFTRESARRIQQQRLNEYVDQLSLQAGINAANTGGRGISAIEAATATSLQGQNQDIISSLRQARATGRIVLSLLPETKSASQLPAISLENGDVFIVPHRPSTVSVAGAVYTPNTFLFEPARRVSYYLGLAGGPNHNADRKRAYVIRADGSVISKQQLSSLRRNAFDSLRLYPGDTVIVPLNLNKGATLRNVVDIAQIFGQFGIALAAANVIF